jgi:hypothetical protein
MMVHGTLTHYTGKNTTHLEDSIANLQDELHDSEDEEDATAEDLNEGSFADLKSAAVPGIDHTTSVLPDFEERRSTFTFTMDAATVEDLPDYESLDGLGDCDYQETEDDTPTDDATIVRLFQSPVKGTAPAVKCVEEIMYPDLPQSDNDEVDSGSMLNSILTAESTLLHHANDYLLGTGAADISIGESEELANDQDVLAERTEYQEEDRASEDARDTQAATESDFEPHSLGVPNTGLPIVSSDIAYPSLPIESSPRNCNEEEAVSTLEEPLPLELVEEDTEMCEAQDQSMDHSEYDNSDVKDNALLNIGEEENADEEFTEASLQLNILREYHATLDGEQSVPREFGEEDSRISALQDGQAVDVTETMNEDVLPIQDASEQLSVVAETADITDGLTLSFTPAKVHSVEPTPRKLHSPPPPPVQSGLDDMTMTIALDDDTAILKGFLNRVAASKAEKAAVRTHRRESLQNRRDSDVIRHALASPRKVLEDKDPNSPSKYDNELTLDLSQTLTLSMPDNALAVSKTDSVDFESPADESLHGSRRSSRAKKSRLPAPASAAQAQASKIAIRRADGTEHVVLKKSDAQELSLLTRTNTRKNKQGAFGVTVRLMKLAVDAAHLPPLDDSTKEPVIGKNIRWDEQLAYYQENPETVAEAESLATPDELGMPDAVSTPSSKPKSKVSKNSTPKIRRVRGLGSTNGTPGKVLLAPSSFPAEPVEEEKEAAPAQATTQQLPRPKASKMKKMAVAPVSTPSDSKLPTLDIIPVGVEPTKERKSRLAAPKKVMLPQPVTALPAEGKENTQRTGLSGATPKKGIPAPKVIVPPSVGMESGLPRRRGRKM